MSNDSRSNRLNSMCLALIFALAIFVLCCEFEFFATTNSIMDCLIHPSLIVTIYFEKIAIALFVSSFLFLVKRKWLSLVFAFILSVWILAELIYLNFFNGMLIDGYSIRMASNMEGFWNSIIPFFKLGYLWLLCPIVILGLAVLKIPVIGRNIRCALLFLTTSLFFHLSYAVYCNSPWKKDVTSRIPLSTALRPIFSDHFDTASLSFSTTYSVLHCFARVTVELFDNEIVSVDISQLSEKLEKKGVSGLGNDIVPNSKLILILVESLESWTIIPEITPNLCNLLNCENILWAPQVKKQTKRGQSADGQMIVNTGILPISRGAACYRFSTNKYPSISELYSSTYAFIPGGIGVWNQGMMCKAYHIDHLIETSNDDADIINQFMAVKNEFDYALILTASSHSPFSKYADSSSIVLPNSMPKVMSDYLKSINYMDRSLSNMLSQINSDSVLSRATIVITGDHTIFSEEQRLSYNSYCTDSGLTQYKVLDDYCPLLVLSPNIESKTICDTIAYQMDIYPTILNIIGCGENYWQGFGINLATNDNRVFSQDEAFSLSEQIFYSDYFNSIQ